MTSSTTTAFNRPALEAVLQKRFFYAPSFSIYGGVAGLYDLGPPGAALMSNILQLWRQHFVLEEDMLELDSAIVTPHDVLKASGHVDRFTDWMVKDTKTGDIFRADHLVEAALELMLEGDKLARAAASPSPSASPAADGAAAPAADAKKDKKKKKKAGEPTALRLDDSVVTELNEILAQIDNFGGPELKAIIDKFNVKSPETGNDLSDPVTFNLMFETSIGPTGHLKGYLRPETAQGQFVNFKKLLEFNNDKMPFASALIGRAFRNEISPRSGLIRLREFTLAEIEHFVDPDNKDHHRFDEIKDDKLYFLPAAVQQAGSKETQLLSIQEAIDRKIIGNQTLGYFLARIARFLIRVGIHPEKLRFREHMSNEMAHYACGCFDAEILTSYGWVECVGCADRSAYDLTVHTQRTKEKLVVRETLPTPRVVSKVVLEINKKELGTKLKKAAKPVEEALLALTECELETLMEKLNLSETTIKGTDGAEYGISKTMVSIERKDIRETVREYTPNVIEPAFGITRIMYAAMEHAFWAREGDEMRTVLSFTPAVAPFKCLLLPLSGNKVFAPIVKDLAAKLRKLNISTKIDDSSSVSIGRRYARNDEIGTPFGITVDFQTAEDGTVTLRERDSTKQVREHADVIMNVLKQLIDGAISWEEVMNKYPVVESAKDDEE
ncbi:glycyl-tRNA synthetase 1 [Ramicandelaber brevisporus]|nr:glycyl-tRNA synthetase 1 [Ramicandelaber brevisporus]